ncbi:MAG TPA: cytochrome P450 [Anaerolineae bacterium]|nr:cytochrome P450 [Anaerolineae bacterium]
MLTVDVTTPEVRQNPHPIYARLRRESPVARGHKMPGIGQLWLISRYQDVNHFLKSPNVVNNYGNVPGHKPQKIWFLPQILQLFMNSMLNQDGDDHRRLRTLVHQAFTPRRIDALHTDIEQIVNQLLDDAATQDTVDLLTAFSFPIPITIISKMVGVPIDKQHIFQEGADALINANPTKFRTFFDLIFPSRRLIKYITQLIHEHKQNPQDDILTALIDAEADDSKLNEKELLAMIFLLLGAGYETTAQLITNGVFALLQNPEQWRLLCQKPELIPTAVEELIRYTGPTDLINPRHLCQPIELHGHHLPKGSILALLPASANRDETVFTNPDQLDITRTPNKHLGFGLGTHYCLGAPLARMETQIALRALTQRFPNLSLAVPPETIRWRPSITARGLQSLPVKLS